MSSDPIEPTPLWHWSLLTFIGVLRFVNLGFLDLQAWDEALYIVRAQGILRFGGWLDQSGFAIDGLYSALHPPLQVWLTAAVFALLDTNEFTARIVPALAGAATLPVIALIGKRLANPSVGLIAALLFGLNPFVTMFARQGQFDTLLVLLISLSLLFYIRMTDTRSVQPAFWAGICLGAALMTKLFVAMGIPVAILSFLLLRRRPLDPILSKRLLLSVGVAALVSLPWHMFMAAEHAGGNLFFFLTESALVERALFGIEGNVKPLETLYYMNQLIVLFPFGIFWFFAGFRSFWASDEPANGLLLHWFLVFFVVFSLMRTKLAVYMLPMFVPASLVAGKTLWEFAQSEVNRKQWFFLLSGTSLAFLWSASQHWRTAVKDLAGSLLSLSLPAESVLSLAGSFALASVTLIGFTYMLTRVQPFPRIRVHIISVMLLILAGQMLADVIIADQRRFKDGGTELGAFVHDNKIIRIIVAGYERNPQLTYYLGGADIGWNDGLSVRRIIPPKDSLSYSPWLAKELGGEPESVFLVIEKDKFVRYRIIDPSLFVPEDWRAVFESRRYSGYTRSPSAYLAGGTE